MGFLLNSPGLEVPPSSQDYVLQHDLDRKDYRKHSLHVVEHGGLLVADVVTAHPNNDHVQNYCPMDCLTMSRTWQHRGGCQSMHMGYMREGSWQSRS